MKNYQCSCGNRLFFDNTNCLACGLDVGFCPQCQNMTSLTPQSDGTMQCGHSKCKASLIKCSNYLQYNVCNRCVAAPSESSEPGTVANLPKAVLCDCCRFNHTIPDLTVTGNREKWARLEAAKRRLIFDMDLLKLPYGTAADGIDPPLAFDFKGDVLAPNNRTHSLSQGGRVFTGHDGGTITINIIEADDVEREKARVTLGEPQRTLLGHFRHEIGHYFWDLLVKDKCESEFITVFGDHHSPTYTEALETYYKNGPPANWPENYISAYATMHPWEDFAETWATYFNLISELDTAVNVQLIAGEGIRKMDLPALVVQSQTLGIALNEMNRSLGLMDAVPKPLVTPVVEKLKFIHELVRTAKTEMTPSGTSQPSASQSERSFVGMETSNDEQLVPAHAG